LTDENLGESKAIHPKLGRLVGMKTYGHDVLVGENPRDSCLMTFIPYPMPILDLKVIIRKHTLAEGKEEEIQTERTEHIQPQGNTAVSETVYKAPAWSQNGIGLERRVPVKRRKRPQSRS
jgi:hypothetical protein